MFIITLTCNKWAICRLHHFEISNRRNTHKPMLQCSFVLCCANEII
uniref:Uncharacterized protein n=1 Tax=Anguilla anguilla TaxID=7936 RepID=A0A0E9TLB9_ANGAN